MIITKTIIHIIPIYYLYNTFLQVVSKPMDMIRISQKIILEDYDDLAQMSADVELMVANAKVFYKVS